MGSDSNDKHSTLHLASDDVALKLKKKMGLVSTKEKEKETSKLAVQFGLPYIDLEKFPISLESLRQISREEAEALGLICFYFAQDEIRFGALDPGREGVREKISEIEEKNHVNGGLYVISAKSFERVLKLYDTLPTIKPITKDIEIHQEDLDKVKAEITDFKSFQALLDKQSTTDLVTLILGVALKLDASDLHVEAEAEKVVVRLRLDGVLYDAATLKKDVFPRLISRIKLVSSLKINITDKPQDGRFSMKLNDGDIDVRVSTLPTVYGESIVMRLLRQSRQGLSLEGIGLVGEALARLKEEISRPNGMVIITGPTGSGKTTTMYAIMQILNEPGVKIITLEDPVEYKMEGINQSQTDEGKGYTFAKGLRSILRQDPDIAMVGEIRDLETAEIAIQAALTGHLILSTIHTNSAAGAIPRFLAIGAKPFLLAPALNCIIGQRLVRRICRHCLIEEERDAVIQSRLEKVLATMTGKEKAKIDLKNIKTYKGQGCKECGGLGYKGRIGIFEIFSIDEEIEQIILSGRVSEYAIEELAVKKGMITMVQDGILKALDKLTSLEEVFRVVD